MMILANMLMLFVMLVCFVYCMLVLCRHLTHSGSSTRWLFTFLLLTELAWQ